MSVEYELSDIGQLKYNLFVPTQTEIPYHKSELSYGNYSAHYFYNFNDEEYFKLIDKLYFDIKFDYEDKIVYYKWCYKDFIFKNINNGICDLYPVVLRSVYDKKEEYNTKYNFFIFTPIIIKIPYFVLKYTHKSVFSNYHDIDDKIKKHIEQDVWDRMYNIKQSIETKSYHMMYFKPKGE